MKRKIMIQLVPSLLILLVPCALFARDFRDRIDAACVARIPVHDSFEIKGGPAKEWGKTYTIGPKGSKKFTLLLSVIKSSGISSGPAFVREQVAEQGKKMLGDAAEKSLDIRELKAEGAAGYYYRITDRNPRPEEYLYMIQGQVGRSSSIASFTYLFNQDSAPELERVMAAVTGAHVTCEGNLRENLRRLRINAEDLREKCTLGEELIGKSIKVQHYFLAPDAYSRAVAPPVAKEIQSVERGRDRGSIMFFKFGMNIEDRKGVFDGLFYGADGGPSDDQPEEIVIHRDIMIIFCFERNSALKKEVKSVILGRLK